MKKLTKLFVLIILLGCGSEDSGSLNNDAIAIKYFNKEEIHELSELLNFFENQVGIETSTNNIYNSYESFLEILNPKEIEILISFERQESFLADINPKLLNELWYYEQEFVPYLNDTVQIVRYPKKGKYFEFLFAASEKDKGIEKYFEDYIAAGSMSPTLLAYTMKYHKENGVNYNLNLERNRLIIAINYLIYNEQLRLDEIQRNKKSSVHNK